MASTYVPLIPDKPWECPAGHRWGPGRVLVGWQTCAECSEGRANFNGHSTMRCGLRSCGWRYYSPPCDGQEWIRVGGTVTPGR